ncbi:Cysteine desulfurase-like protein ustD [Colletotrichum sp. SAR 10_86]|nr:Cysteine desulfurase-like protein ustD [Colletotrichum sp. SAR 10_65]KAI8172328.1 Cysteine desulfurase-like protein ustD [Colletotrichum sp. SAR 10_75]KAI8195766.1 Cysteine desulfurase-like protein ustD [Colletotrichum sp. SAR 10_76]KAI8218175.1 Cysteine desulfurase-like protein ustD [Colletotrichum sp. SAR 10_86]KAJ4994814.1 Cysteine desulfurase-like protein ustD [Colletotrichum sp. SAR 10_66]
MSAQIDIAATRAKFPALGQDQVFFDNAGGSQTLGTVIDSIRDYLSQTNVQLGASYKVGQRSTALYGDGYQAGAKYISASPDEIVFGASTTQLFRNLSHTFSFSKGDEIVVSGVDHEANIASWVDLAAHQDLVLKWWKPDKSPNPKLTVDNLKPLLSDKTRLVTCTHASNILGTIHDVGAIASLVHESTPRGLVCVDGVAYAPHRPIDVKALGVDFYAFSWYKVYGPHTAMLYASRKAQNTHMRSLGHFFNQGDTLEGKLGLAGGSYELVSAVPKVLEYLGTPNSDGWKGKIEQERQLQSTLLEYLNGRGDVTIYGESDAGIERRVPTISFRVKNWGARELVETVEKETDFGFRWGHFYSYRLLKDVLGLDPSDGIVRVSMVHYNSLEEIKSFVAALDKALAQKK